MSKIVLIDYGCHSFTYRLSTYLSDLGVPILYFVNGSLESPNLTSLQGWIERRPDVVRRVTCDKPYGKLNLWERWKGETAWTKRCLLELEREKPSAIVVSTLPITVVSSIQRWTERHGIPLVYWLQDLQGKAIHDLLGQKLGMPGRVLGSFASIWEQRIIKKSRMVITIAAGHDLELPQAVRRSGRHAMLENWANIEEFPEYPIINEWSTGNNLDKTFNILYSGTLGLKHDLSIFVSLATHFSSRQDVRIVIVSSGRAAELLKRECTAKGLRNLLVLPFQPYNAVPQVLASASVLIAPLDASAGTFCVPSKVLSYFCAGRPTVIAIEQTNPAAVMIKQNALGAVVASGDAAGFVAAVARFLDNPAEREDAGRRARAYAERTFSLQLVARKFVAIIASANIPLGAEADNLDCVTAKSAASA